MPRQNTIPGLLVRITFQVCDPAEGRAILEHLVEERLVAGGTVIDAISLNWVGGGIRRKERREVTAYTTMDKVPIIRKRLEVLTDGDSPPPSVFVMTDRNQSVMHWIERNVRITEA